MRYHIHYGKLFPVSPEGNEDCLCYISQPVYTQNKILYSADGSRVVFVEIAEAETGSVIGAETSAGPQYTAHRYIIKEKDGRLLAEGRPGYSGQAPVQPLSRGPRADHVVTRLPDISCRLIMQNSQNFILTADGGRRMMELIHNGVSGGWNITADGSLDVMLVMGIFLFSRYLEKENEFVVV